MNDFVGIFIDHLYFLILIIIFLVYVFLFYSVFFRKEVIDYTKSVLFVFVVYLFGFRLIPFLDYMIIISMVNIVFIEFYLERIINNRFYCELNRRKIESKMTILFNLSILTCTLLIMPLFDDRVDLKNERYLKVLTIKDLIQNGIFKKVVPVSDYLDKFVKYRNKERIYKSINCGVMSMEDCHIYRSNYIWSVADDR